MLWETTPLGKWAINNIEKYEWKAVSAVLREAKERGIHPSVIIDEGGWELEGGALRRKIDDDRSENNSR